MINNGNIINKTIDLYLTENIINNHDKMSIINIYNNLKYYYYNTDTITSMLLSNKFPYCIFIDTQYINNDPPVTDTEAIRLLRRIVFKHNNKVFKVFKVFKKYGTLCKLFFVFNVYFQKIFYNNTHNIDFILVPKIYNYGIIEHNDTDYYELFIEMEYIQPEYINENTNFSNLFDLYKKTFSFLKKKSLYHYDISWFYKIVNNIFMINENFNNYGTSYIHSRNNKINYDHITNSQIINNTTNISEIVHILDLLFNINAHDNLHIYEKYMIPVIRCIIDNSIHIPKSISQLIYRQLGNAFMHDNKLVIIDFEFCGRVPDHIYYHNFFNINKKLNIYPKHPIT